MKYPNILFLDLDGPLFSRRALMLSENNEFSKIHLEELQLDPRVTYWYADPVAIMMLIELYRLRSFKIVISSSWADPDLHDKEQIERLLKKNLLGIPLHKEWRTPRDNPSTIHQIKEWLENNQHNDYVILDDIKSGQEMKNIKLLNDLGIDKDKIVLVDDENGISIRNYYQLQAIVLNWN